MSEYDLEPDEAPTPPPPHPGVLNYRPPHEREPSRRREASTVGPFVIGFFSALMMCGASVYAMGATYDAPAGTRWLVFCGVIAAVIALMAAPSQLGRFFGLAGMGRGVATGLILGMMALGPCAGCYFIMLLG